MSPPTFVQLKALHAELRRVGSGRKEFAVNSAPCFSPDEFTESAAKLEIEIMEKLDFNLVTRNSFQRKNAKALEQVHDTQDALKLHALAFSLGFTEHAWRQPPTTVTSVSHELFHILYQISPLTSNSKLFIKDNPLVAAQLLSAMWELYAFFES